MAALNEQVYRLRAEIEHLEGEASDLEVEVLDLRQTLTEFEKRYNRQIKPLLDRLEAVRGAIQDIESQRHTPSSSDNAPEQYTDWMGDGYESVADQYQRMWRSAPDNTSTGGPSLTSDWRPEADYISVEEQFRRTWQRSTNDETPPLDPDWWNAQPENAPQGNLRQLYRKLVRQYHPDLTTDPAERQRRNQLMVEINRAYAERNDAALRALAAHPSGGSIEVSLAALELRQLRQVRDQLLGRVARLKQERNDLFNSDMMWSKIQDTLLAREGRSYLQERAKALDAEYGQLLRRLDALRDR